MGKQFSPFVDLKLGHLGISPEEAGWTLNLVTNPVNDQTANEGIGILHTG